MEQSLQKDIEVYVQKYNDLQKKIGLLQADLLRLEGLILYLKEKSEQSTLTNQ